MRPFPLLAAIALMAPAPALASSDGQLWTTAIVGTDISGPLKVQNEFIARFSDDRNGLYEIENNLLFGYKLSDKITLWAGYVHNPQYDGGDFTIMERRGRQQVTFDNIAKFGKAQLSLRLRTEERWRESGVTGTAFRIRPYAKLAIPLGGKSAPTLNLSNETFFNLNNTSFQTADGLERARTQVSLQVPLSKQLRGEIGYLNQHRFVRDGDDNDDHALTLAVSLAL